MLSIYKEKSGTDKFVSKDIEVIPGRSIKIKKCNNGVAYFHYDDLILEIFGATDYIAMTKHFHTFILTGVP